MDCLLKCRHHPACRTDCATRKRVPSNHLSSRRLRHFVTKTYV